MVVVAVAVAAFVVAGFAVVLCFFLWLLLLLTLGVVQY